MQSGILTPSWGLHSALQPPLGPRRPAPVPSLWASVCLLSCFCSIIFFPSVRSFLPLLPSAPVPTGRAPRGLPEARSPAEEHPFHTGRPSGMLFPRPVPRPASSSTSHSGFLSGCSRAGFLSPVLWPQLTLGPPFIHSCHFTPSEGVRGTFQEPCAALCCAGGAGQELRYPQPSRGLMEKGDGGGEGRRGR